MAAVEAAPRSESREASPLRAADVLISNGFNRFHLAVAASEVAARGRLSQMLTGAYPTARVAAVLRRAGLSRSPKIARLLARKQPSLDERRVTPLWLAEVVYEVGAYARRFRRLERVGAELDRRSFRVYAHIAAGKVAAARGTTRIYHYRSGFGHRSAEVARRRGMVLLCDHTIAHPAVLEYLVANDGAMPPAGVELRPSPRLADLLEDVDRADEVLVNSDFVKSTFLAQGWDAAKVHVVYLGVEESFLRAIPPRPSDARGPTDELRLLFAGAVSRRKGAHPLLTALASLDDVPWRLDLVGFVDREVGERHSALLADPRVRCIGTLPHLDVARLMADADVFVFPSLAEGSARVVFEALASGCYVITTPNAGSIVEDGVHGGLIPPGDPAEIATAIRTAAADRGRVLEIGRANSALVRADYRQHHYGDGLITLYDALLDAREGLGR